MIEQTQHCCTGKIYFGHSHVPSYNWAYMGFPILIFLMESTCKTKIDETSSAFVYVEQSCIEKYAKQNGW
jgi:hypothetical protein